MLVTVFIGLFGALIGGAASIGAVWIQSHYQTKRERLRLVMDVAVEDHKSSIELAKQSGRQFSAPPVTLYLHYHLELIKVLEKGALTPEDLREITSKNKELNKAIETLQDVD